MMIDRRDFLRMSGLLSGSLGLPPLIHSTGLEVAAAHSASHRFDTVTAHVSTFSDVVNVVVLQRNKRAIAINSGSGAVAEALAARGVALEWVLYTNYEREHTAGAAHLKSRGVKLAVPAGEASFFRSVNEFWRDADSILDHRYDFRPGLTMLRQSVEPDRELSNGDRFEWQDLTVEVLATPGCTDGGLSFILEIDGQKIAATGSLIEPSGQMRDFYKLQKPFPGMYIGLRAGKGGYLGFGGGVPELKRSLDAVLSRKPSMLIPSHGNVMRDPVESVAALKRNLDAAMRNYLTLTSWRTYFAIAGKTVPTGYDDLPTLPSQPEPKTPSWLHELTEQSTEPDYPLIPTSWYLLADDGSIFLFDCGFPPVAAAIAQMVHDQKITTVDCVWISHYHDDHVASVNEIRARYGASVYAQREMQDILENPTAYDMPCLFPESIHVDRPLAEGQVIEWKGYRMTAYYFPGQTLYHGALLVERDGVRILFTGDSIANFGIDDYCAYNRNFLGGVEPGFQRCLRLLLEIRPDLMIAAHFGTMPFAPGTISRALELLEQRKVLFDKLLAWPDANCGLDPQWIRTYPFRQKVFPCQLVTLEARIFNHSAMPKLATVHLNARDGWIPGPGGQAQIPPHTEGAIQLTARAPKRPQAARDVLAIAVEFDGADLGEAAVAIVDYYRG